MRTILPTKVVRAFLASGVTIIAAASFCFAQQEQIPLLPPPPAEPLQIGEIPLRLDVPVPAQQQGEQLAQQLLNVENARPKPKLEPAKLDRIAEKLKIAEPVTHENLSIYLIEGDDITDTSKVLTLSEALGKKGKVVVRETSDVNELKVRNKAKGETIFLMAGDIVKGGKQDRTLGTDLPLETKAGEVPMSAFCVEQGRWRARGGEDVTVFSGSLNSVVTKGNKIAVRQTKDQGEVWKSVSAAQTKISANVAADVTVNGSPTSLQLALENKELRKLNAERLAKLKPIVEKNERAIGFVTVINGEINSAEIFAGHDLFRRAWPRLAEAASTEAVSELKGKAADKPATAENVMEFIAKAEDAEAKKEKIHSSFSSVTAESESLLLFQTIDESKGGRWLRRCIIKK